MAAWIMEVPPVSVFVYLRICSYYCKRLCLEWIYRENPVERPLEQTDICQEESGTGELRFRSNYTEWLCCNNAVILDGSTCSNHVTADNHHNNHTMHAHISVTAFCV